jgi:hypothetical protein
MNAALTQLERELTTALQDLDASQTQLGLIGNPTGWSIHQIVQHLLLTYASTEAAFKSRLAKGTPTLSRSTLIHRAVKFIVITCGLMPRRHKAPPEVTPAKPSLPLSGDQLSLAVSHSLASLDSVLNHAEQAFGTQPCQSHFALGPLNATQWRRFHLAHGRHHIRQILAIRRTRNL